MEASKLMWVLFCSCFCLTERFSKVSVVIAISINQTLKLYYRSECLFQVQTAISNNVYELLVPPHYWFVCFCFCSEMLLAKLLLVTGTQVPPAPLPQCPSPAVFLYYKPGLQYTLHLPISCASCNRESLGCAGERHVPEDPRGVVSSEGGGALNQVWNQAPAQSPMSDALPSPFPFPEVQLCVTLLLRC